jgi:hypothetical protein
MSLEGQNSGRGHEHCRRRREGAGARGVAWKVKPVEIQNNDSPRAAGARLAGVPAIPVVIIQNPTGVDRMLEGFKRIVKTFYIRLITAILPFFVEEIGDTLAMIAALIRWVCARNKDQNHEEANMNP